MLTSESEIAARINEWAFYRDREGQDGLIDTFREGGTISVSWYDGPWEGFVAASKRMTAGGNALVKHRLGVPKIRIRTAVHEKDRADPVSAPSLPAAFFEGLERFPAEVRFLVASAWSGSPRRTARARRGLPATGRDRGRTKDVDRGRAHQAR
jgi:hypothetical protein